MDVAASLADVDSIVVVAIVFAVASSSVAFWLAFRFRSELTAKGRLGRSEQQYRLLFDHNPNPMWVYARPSLAFLAVNEAALRNYGYSRNVFFPQFTSPGEGPRPDALAGEVPGGTETILLVEDDASLRVLAVRVLKSHGYEVLSADGPREALSIAANGGRHIDAVVTDVVMPEMNGRELVEKLLETRPGIAFLLMSGYTDDHVLRSGVLRGGTAFLQKPFTPEQLARKLRSVIDRITQ